ncbi:MAG: hypothetical protein WDZ40_04205 [Candidatus Spechtbacterales bacterium]
MTKDGEKLNIVNKKGEIIGEATREDIHGGRGVWCPRRVLVVSVSY